MQCATGGMAVLLAWLSNWKYGSGSKQMEYSYLDDPFVATFKWLISPEVMELWAGNYGCFEVEYKETLRAPCSSANHTALADR
ncbi:hypothetical protein EON63_20100 [archaeon]|nr:MAG: hypothetical protein EON63_20100 [archaeon]